jgi:hypothetical protein
MLLGAAYWLKSLTLSSGQPDIASPRPRHPSTCLLYIATQVSVDRLTREFLIQHHELSVEPLALLDQCRALPDERRYTPPCEAPVHACEAYCQRHPRCPVGWELLQLADLVTSIVSVSVALVGDCRQDVHSFVAAKQVRRDARDLREHTDSEH